jgi:DNA-binding CsgD family transcriptional regulator
LERRGVIQLVADGSHTVARLGNPVLGEAAMQRAGVVRTRQLTSLLAQQLQKHMQTQKERSGFPDVRARIQLAQFMMRSDLSPDLDLIIRAAASAMTMSNFACGEELARFALDQGGGLWAAIVLAEAMGWQGRSAEVEAVLGAFDPEGADELMTAHGCMRAANLFWCGQIEQARLGLANVRDRLEFDASVGLITAMEVVFAFFSGEVSTAVETGLALCAGDMPPVVTAWAAAATSWALALTGRYGAVHRIADTGLRAADLGHSGPLRLVIGWGEVMALTAAGDFSAAEQVWKRYAAMPAGAPAVHAVVNAMLGLVDLARGVLPSASSAFQNSLSAMSRGSPFSWLMLVAALSAQVEGARGDSAAAAAALRRSEEAYGPQTAVFLPELELARAWERASVGQASDAQTHAVRAAQIARQSGMYAVEMRALHTAVRFDDRSQTDRLAELATTLNTPLAEAIAQHARGLADHDGDVLDAAADRFADMGAVALAADAAAQAAREHARTGRHGQEIKSSTRAHGLARQGGIRTPAVDAAALPSPITAREHEIANLVAAGLSNRQIADRLIVSVRTVEGHVYRIFAKLGIDDRDQLVHLVRLTWRET